MNNSAIVLEKIEELSSFFKHIDELKKLNMKLDNILLELCLQDFENLKYRLLTAKEDINQKYLQYNCEHEWITDHIELECGERMMKIVYCSKCNKMSK